MKNKNQKKNQLNQQQKMEGNPHQNHSKLLILLGGLIYVSSFCIYSILLNKGDYYIDNEDVKSIIVEITYEFYVDIIKLDHIYLTPEWLNNISIYGRFITIGLIFTGMAINESNKALKHLIFYNISSFCFLLFLTYAINDLFDIWINSLTVINCIIITTIACLIYYLYVYFKS